VIVLTCTMQPDTTLIVNHIGPQTSFPVRESKIYWPPCQSLITFLCVIAQGILNYQGADTLAVSLWDTDAGGVKSNSLGLQFTGQVESTMPAVINQPAPNRTPRVGAY